MHQQSQCYRDGVPGATNSTYTFYPYTPITAVTCVLSVPTVPCTTGSPATSNVVNIIVPEVCPTTFVTGVVGSGEITCYDATQTITVAGGGTTFTVNEGGQEDPEALLQKASFKLWPNPTTGKFTLEQTGGSPASNVAVAIYGMHGEKVMIRELTGQKRHELSIEEFPAGLYFVKVVAGEYTGTIKLIKTN